jgi:hypothetical protein
MKDKKSKLEEIETSHTLGKDCRIWIVPRDSSSQGVANDEDP